MNIINQDYASYRKSQRLRYTIACSAIVMLIITIACLAIFAYQCVNDCIELQNQIDNLKEANNSLKANLQLQ